MTGRKTWRTTLALSLRDLFWLFLGTGAYDRRWLFGAGAAWVLRAALIFEMERVGEEVP